MNLSERTETLKSFDGTDIFFRCYTPRRKNGERQKLDGVVLGVHNFGDHSGRYTRIASATCEHNIAFAAFDLRGHGKSGPRRGDAESMHALILDVLFVINHARSILGFSRKQEIFLGLFGQGFGALLLLYAAAAMRDYCPPLFLSSPLLRRAQKRPFWYNLAQKSMPQILPVSPLTSLFPGQDLSENPANNAEWEKDPLILRNISVRMEQLFNEALNDANVRHVMSLIHTPVCIVCGGKDKISDTARTQELFPYLTSTHSHLSFVDDAGHDIFNEPKETAEHALAVFRDWLTNKGAL